MIIDERRIEKKGLQINDTIKLDDAFLLEDESYFSKDLAFSLFLVRDGEKIKTRGSIKTAISVRCVKCLDNFDLKINSKFDVILFPLTEVDFSYSALKQDDMEYIFYENGKIDVEKLLLEQVNLNIPYKAICGGNCRGMCPICGTNLNHEKCKCDSTTNEINIFYDIKR